MGDSDLLRAELLRSGRLAGTVNPARIPDTSSRIRMTADLVSILPNCAAMADAREL
jgi:hypothetical protein